MPAYYSWVLYLNRCLTRLAIKAENLLLHFDTNECVKWYGEHAK